MSGLGLDGSARIGRLKRSRAESIIQSAKCASWRPKNRIKEATTVHAPCRSFSGTMRRWTRIGQGGEARELDRRGGRRGDVHGLLRGEIRGRRDPGREAAFDPREPGAGGDRGAGRTRRRGGAAWRGAAAGARNHGRDQRHHPAPRRTGGTAHDGRIPRSPGDRPADPAAHVRPLPGPASAPRAARAAPRGGGADHLGGGAWSGLSGTRRSPRR